MADKKLYFGPLDTLRTYAFLIVFISHAYFSFFTVTDNRTRLVAHGEVGVHIFFVLSAFLITYLSLREHQKTQSFALRHFFKKRILRIWPLYFIVLGGVYAWHFIAAPEQSMGCAPMFFYFLGNFCVLQGLPDSVGTPALTPMWSISVEQQFYVVFPLVFAGGVWLLKKRKSDLVKPIAFLGIFSMLAYSLVQRFMNAGDWAYINYATVTVLPGFICGVILAYAIHANVRIVGWVRENRQFSALAAITAFVGAFFLKFEGDIGAALYIMPIALATMIYIILATGDRSNEVSDKTEKQISAPEYLGRISYGLYAYHLFAIVFMQYLDLPIGPLAEALIALGITIVLAQISYKYIEQKFLKFK